MSGPQSRPQFVFRWNHNMWVSLFCSGYAVDNFICATFQWVLSHPMLSTFSTHMPAPQFQQHRLCPLLAAQLSYTGSPRPTPYQVQQVFVLIKSGSAAFMSLAEWQKSIRQSEVPWPHFSPPDPFLGIHSEVGRWQHSSNTGHGSGSSDTTFGYGKNAGYGDGRPSTKCGYGGYGNITGYGNGSSDNIFGYGNSSGYGDCRAGSTLDSGNIIVQTLQGSATWISSWDLHECQCRDPVQTSVHLSMEHIRCGGPCFVPGMQSTISPAPPSRAFCPTQSSSRNPPILHTSQLLNFSNTAPVHSLQSNSLLHGLSSPYSIWSPTGICLDKVRACGFHVTGRVPIPTTQKFHGLTFSHLIHSLAFTQRLCVASKTATLAMVMAAPTPRLAMATTLAMAMVAPVQMRLRWLRQHHWLWQWQLQQHFWLWQQHWLWRLSLQHTCGYGNITGKGSGSCNNIFGFGSSAGYGDGRRRRSETTRVSNI